MICVHCDFKFDPRGTRKILAGGKINECADCVEELGTETAVKYLGCASADGKMGESPFLRLIRMKHAKTIEPRGTTTTGCTKERVQPSQVLTPQ